MVFDVVGRARSTVFFVVRGTEASEDGEVVNECTEVLLISRRRDDFNRFMMSMLRSMLEGV